MSILNRVVIGIFTMLTLGMATEESFAITLPACIPGVTCLQFGDFNVYSLALLNLQAGGTATSGPFYVQDSPGSILNNVVVGQNNGHSGAGTGIDGAYNTPSQNSGGASTFTTADPTTYLSPRNAFTGDTPGTWNATISNLGLNGGPLVVYFGYNETGGTGLLNSDLLVWAQVSLYNYTSPTTFTADPTTYTLGFSSTAPSLTNLPTAAGATQASVASDGWVYIHSEICVDSSNQFVGFPDGTGSCSYLGGTATGMQNNLGNNAAAFAIDSLGLDTALNSGDWNVMSVNWEMAYLNGGGETAFIQTTTILPPRTVPEPMTLSLLGIGLLGLWISRRRIGSN